MPQSHSPFCARPRVVEPPLQLGFLSSQAVPRRLQQHCEPRGSLASPGFFPGPARLGWRCLSSNGSDTTSARESRTSSDTKVERLRKWLTTLNHDNCNLKVERCGQGSSGSGYGAFAGAGGVAKGSVVVKVPRKALMTEETAMQCEHIGPLVKKGNLSPWQAMCLHLLFERACGEASFWYPYIALLPTDLELVGTHPMLWPQKMRREWLEGSPMLEVTERRLGICRFLEFPFLYVSCSGVEFPLLCDFSHGSIETRHWDVGCASCLIFTAAWSCMWPTLLLQRTKQLTAVFREDHEAMLLAGAGRLVPRGHGSKLISITETAVHWAASILLSRSFSLTLQDQKLRAGSIAEETVALVPWADMLNHSSAAGRESCLVYDHRSGVATLQAHCTYSEGDQVFDSYGPSCSPSRLLLDYGFVDEENSNHSVDLLASVLGPVNSNANELLLQASGLPFDGAVFSLSCAGVDESVMAWTRAAVATRQELYDAGWREGVHERAAGYPSAATVMFRFSKPINRANESEVLRRLLSTCDYLLKKYPTTYEQDVDMLASPGTQTPKVIPWGRKQAIRALLSEKRALKEAQDNFGKTLSKLRLGSSLDSLYH